MFFNNRYFSQQCKQFSSRRNPKHPPHQRKRMWDSCRVCLLSYLILLIHIYGQWQKVRPPFSHDIVLDCTDNIATRYLLNDACAACGPIPLVSGSALRFEGQLTVYLTSHLPNRDADSNPEGEAKRRRMIEEERIPCFRCINPVPPPAVQACSDAGVLGVGEVLLIFPIFLY